MATRVELYDFETARKILGLSRQSLYKIIDQTGFDPIVMGKRKVFTKGDILYLNQTRPPRWRKDALMFTQ